MAYYQQWRPYVPVAKRRQEARKKMAALRKKGVNIQPIEIEGRKIAIKFWGEAWCDHLESFSDYANRLPRGRTYVRNGSVCHLAIEKGKIEAKVSGSEIYDVTVRIKTLSAKKWNALKKRCSGQVGSLLELLRGDLSDNIMHVVTDRKKGLFPSPTEISFNCNCPDWASMCKHVAAAFYGVGARLDRDPELLFSLRGVKHEELIDVDAQVAIPSGSGRGGAKRLDSGDLGDVFGIDLATNEAEEPSSSSAKPNGTSTQKAPRKKTSLGKANRASAKTQTTAELSTKKRTSKTTAKKKIAPVTKQAKRQAHPKKKKKASIKTEERKPLAVAAGQKATNKKKPKRKTAGSIS